MQGREALLRIERRELHLLRIVEHRRGNGAAEIHVEAAPHALTVGLREAGEAVALHGSNLADTYLRADKLIAAAHQTGADAIHPGYGFLSENADFAQAVIDAGLTWVGPPPAAIHAVGSKSGAKALAQAHGVPCLPGYFGADQSEATLVREAARIGYPVMVKAVAGGGGRGMRLVLDAAQLPAALQSARSEAVSAFGNGDLLIERALLNPRHVEVQVFADTHGHCIHLGERDCSMQRRHQKIIEEAPSPAVDGALRERMGACAVALAHAAGYVGAGTVEFLLDGDQFFLMEMNTRLQVEHPVTEALIGQDLVEWQLRVASGEALPLTQDQVHLQGHAIELRLCAEDADFRPHTGVVSRFRAPPHAAFERRGLRLDHALEDGAVVSPFYDAMLGKLIAHAPTRAEALHRLAHALGETQVLGLPTNRAFLAACLGHPVLAAGGAHIPFLAEHGDALRTSLQTTPAAEGVAALALLYAGQPPAVALASPHPRHLRLRLGSKVQEWLVQETGQGRVRVIQGDRVHEAQVSGQRIVLDGVGWSARAVAVEPSAGVPRWHVQLTGGDLPAGTATELWLDDLGFAPREAAGGASAARELRAPFNGKLIALHVQTGQTVARGAPLLVIESMKLEHTLHAPRDTVIESLNVAPGQQVAPGQLLATFL